MYGEDKIDKQLKAYRLAENNATNTREIREVGKSTDISWYQCTRCSPMVSKIERKCCKCSHEIPYRKFEGGVCISECNGFFEVCLLPNVLKAALGAWHVFRGKNSDLIQICSLQTIFMLDLWKARQSYPKTYTFLCCTRNKKFPVPDNVYTSYTENNLQGQ